MDFRYQCFVVRHVSDRVTIVPLALPRLALHADSRDRALEDLHLALDDRISRAHPRRVAEFVDTSHGTLADVVVDAIPVWNHGSVENRPMRISVVVSPGHKPYVEVRSPRLDLRVWLPAGDDLLERAAPYFAQHVLALKEDQRLALRREAPEELVEITLQATALKLASLRRKELQMSERAPPAPDREIEVRAKPDGEDDDEDETPRDDDDFDDELGRKRPTAPKKPRKKKVTTPTLDKLATALHALAKDGELERAWELDPLLETLLKRVSASKPEPLVLVGPSGIGKTAAVHELAVRLAELAREGKKRLFFDLPPSRWIAGEGFFGDWQRQAFDVIDEAHRAEAIVYIGHVIDVLDAGKSAHSDHNLAQVLAPALAGREVTFLAEATPEEWARVERRNLGFAQSWSVIRVEEPRPEVSQKILAKVAESIGREKEVTVEEGVVGAVVALTRRFWPYGALVGNAAAFLRRLVGARVHARATVVTGGDAIEQFGAESGIPRVLLRDDIALDPEAVRAFLKARVMGQEAAVARLAEVVSVIKAGLADPKKPVATLFFAGPTGVGKTELSKALAEFVFGSRERLVRLDMGEYAGPDALERLLGEAGAPGHLTASVRRQPFCVVLFDEVEKAHPAVFDALLGVLGEGRLTDSDGKFTDFRNAVIIMTSNLGADTLKARVGFGQGGEAVKGAAVRAHYVGEAERFFRPELFNRIDDFIVFDALGADVLRSIVVREVDKIAARDGLWRNEVALEVGEDAMELLAARGFDPRYGARPLKRTLERELVVPIGDRLADHPARGATKMSVSVEQGALTLRATNVPGRDETVSKAIFQALEAAGKLRGEVRRWGRSRLAESLRGLVSFFLKASKNPGYWREKAIAEEEAQRAEFARRLLDDLTAVTKQAEALEDLAFEAWYTREGASAETLQSELGVIRAQFEPIKRRLFATMFPHTAGVVLYLQAGRSAWHHVEWFMRSYMMWAKAQNLKTTAYTCLWVPHELRPGTLKDDPVAGWRWREHMPNTSESPLPTTAALAVSGDSAQLLFAAESGTQRILDGGSDAVVRVRFEPRAVTHASQLWHPHEVTPGMSGVEIRRFSVSRSMVKDARTQKEHPYATEAFDCGPLFDDYVSWRVFGADAEPWQ
jgi:ATP-dependent Clp protease ATP-binding subunit ClpA